MEYECRICFETFDKRKDVISPCKCAGSMKHVCKTCLNKFIGMDSENKRYTTCPSCKSNYLRNTPKIDIDVSLESNNEIIYEIGFLSFIVPLLLLIGKNKNIMVAVLLIVYFLSMIHAVELLNDDSWGITLLIFMFVFIMWTPEKIAYIGYSTWLILLYAFFSYRIIDVVWDKIFTTKYNNVLRTLKCDMFDFDMNSFVNLE